jgi:hypothetical protein
MRFLKAFVTGFVLSLLGGAAWMFGNLYVPLYWELLRCRQDPTCGGGASASGVGSGSTVLVILIVFGGAFFWSYGGAPKDRFAKTLLVVVGVALLLSLLLSQLAPVP